MTPLAELAASVTDCVVAAWIDARTGAVLARYTADGGQPLDTALDAALDAATEVMRSRQRPPRMVLLSARHVHIIHRLAADPRRALIVICERSPNIGLAVALTRKFAEAEAA